MRQWAGEPDPERSRALGMSAQVNATQPGEVSPRCSKDWISEEPFTERPGLYRSHRIRDRTGCQKPPQSWRNSREHRGHSSLRRGQAGEPEPFGNAICSRLHLCSSHMRRGKPGYGMCITSQLHVNTGSCKPGCRGSSGLARNCRRSEAVLVGQEATPLRQRDPGGHPRAG